ncbi:cob(I)yrinic acid a,c-diamide adenosyltransferase [Prochlorococcus sp. MIT 1341]|uniref:cob(I)yrinic acid a,c-diamide adenosyltransferase n=1 Tax=Prochlorococcus sp. MIT 1341 TaxID=3096221 RepID=UPI002A74E6CD|nr:cob(I)yrinic acid a,c-diamide adenosyltransferase [Prochlorococcus sp. MIT 1341]
MSACPNLNDGLRTHRPSPSPALESLDLKSHQDRFKAVPLHLVKPEGQLHIHTAPYRGSFSMVLSTAIRTAGLGSRVMIAQFLKGGVNQGPEGSIDLCGKLSWIRPAIERCIPMQSPTNKRRSHSEPETKAVQTIWEICRKHLLKGDLDQLVLDEIGLAISLGYLNNEIVMEALEQRPRTMDIILTGPSIPEPIMTMADQITELRFGI